MSTKFSSTQGSRLFFINESASPALIAPVAQMTGFTGLGGKKTKIPITNNDSVGTKEYAGGLMDAGELQFDLIWDFSNANHVLVQTLANSGNATLPFFYGVPHTPGGGTIVPTFTGTIAGGNLVLKPPVTASPKTYVCDGFTFNGYFSMFQIDAATDSVIKVKAGVQQTGGITTIVFGAAGS